MTETGGLSVFIGPKSGIAQLLSLACYAIGRIRFRPRDFRFPEEYALSDVLSMALSTWARRAYPSGLLHGYRAEEKPLRRRFDTHLTVELQYDEFTNDMLSRVNYSCRFGVNQFCRFTSSAWPRCWAASVR